jgi:CheY-like chemotaxis protein
MPPMTVSCDVLIVDDDRAVREAAVALLEIEGLRVAEAEHGAEALSVLAEGLRPKVIVLDMMMPVVDGEKFLRARRLEPDVAAIPVVVFSALQKVPRQLSESRVVAILSKPVEPQRFLRVVREHCR